LLDNILKVTRFDVEWSELKITDLSGIEYFKNLKELRIDFNNVNQLDVSKNLKLEILSVGGNKRITHLDLSKNIALKELYLYHHDAGSCGVKSIDLSKNINLIVLHFDSYLIDSIDLSYNVKLKELNATDPWGRRLGNGLKSLDISKNIALEKLNCYGNRLTQLDLTHNVKLKELNCSSNQLTKLNLEKNLNLEYIQCSKNNLRYLDCTKNKKLTDVWCSEGLLKCVAVPPKTEINYFNDKGRMITIKDTSQTLSEDCK